MSQEIIAGLPDQSVYFKVPAGSTPTNIDLVSTRKLSTPAAKVDATAGSITAHADNTVVYVDPTNAPEVLKVDFPDAAFAIDVDEVILTVRDPVVDWERELRVILIDPKLLYKEFAIWIDDNGFVGTQLGIHGLDTHPTNGWSNAVDLAVALGTLNFRIGVAQSLTANDSLQGHSMIGKNWALDLGDAPGNIITNAYFEGAEITNVGTGSGAKFKDCQIDNNVKGVTLGPCQIIQCRMNGTLTLGTVSGNWDLFDCGTASPSSFELVFSAAGQYVQTKNYNGYIKVSSMTMSTQVLVLIGKGRLTIDSSCTGSPGGIFLAGDWEIVDQASQAVPLIETANISSMQGNTYGAGSYARGVHSLQAIDAGNDIISGKITIVDGNVDAIKLVTDILNTMLEDVSGYRFNTKALETAPKSDATLANQTSIINSLANDTLKADLVSINGQTTIDGSSFNYILELIQAMANGRFVKDTPTPGQITFYKRDNVTVLSIVSVTTSERTRVS